MPEFIVQKADGRFLQLGKRGKFNWRAGRNSATRFPVTLTTGKAEIREVEDRLVYDGVQFTFKEVT